MNVSFCGLSCVIFGRMMDASDEAVVDEAPGDECSAKMVVRCAIHELRRMLVSQLGQVIHLATGAAAVKLTRAESSTWKMKP